MHANPALFHTKVKVLFDHNSRFALAHGGFQIQIEQTKAALERIGVDVEFARWWDDCQHGEIIHYFGRMPASQIQLAQNKGIKVVLAELLTGAGSRTPAQLRLQRFITNVVKKLAPRQFVTAFNWDSYRMADACIANTPWEAHLMSYLFGGLPGRIHIVPNGVEEVFLNSRPVPRGQWMVCTATITERKRVLELAKAAVIARTPIWIIGKPYSTGDSYNQAFLKFAQVNHEFVRFQGPINDRTELAKAYRSARGFVLLSTMETLSLAAGEAAACKCPLLLSDLPWARTVYGKYAQYCPVAGPDRIAPFLRAFYDCASALEVLPESLSWEDVGHQFKRVYESLLRTAAH